jgi:hypothetical protein
VSYMFGDNKTIVDSSTQPHARLHKWHNALSFHRVWEVIASRYVLMMHLSGKANPSDIDDLIGHNDPNLRPNFFTPSDILCGTETVSSILLEQRQVSALWHYHASWASKEDHWRSWQVEIRIFMANRKLA